MSNVVLISPVLFYVPGQVVVEVKKGLMAKYLGKKSLLGADLKRTMNLIAGDFVALKTTSKSTQLLMNELRYFSEVIYVEPNFIYKAISNITDPLYEKLWGMTNTGSNEPDRNVGNPGTAGLAGADINAEKV
jgi:hypothetical protein